MKKKLSFGLIDFEELKWDAYRRNNANPNNFSYWYPIIANKNSKFKTPNSTILTFNKYQYDLMTEHYEKESLVDEFYEMMRYRFTNELSGLDRTKRLFIKNGTYSNKFDFQTCLIEVGDSDDVIIEKSEIINHDSMLKSAGGYGEFVIREYIEGENVDTIYNGMPLRTEFRVFYDFDKHQVMDVVNYWDVDFMLSKGYFEFPDDVQTLNNNKDRINEAYAKHKPKIIEYVKENVDKKTRLDGQWSIDFMLANGEYWLIDMALAHNSAYFTGENHNL